ncbi:MAG: ATP synthase F1 subunit gamma [Bacteriovoracaceae bacterium]|nr:ATP synthase F1 subunit gamma [Bacteriovoracaceae bacterium]
MANIKELKKRIKSTKSTLKITSAMKLVSAAKLAKAQARIQGFKPYSNELDKTVRTASALAKDYSHEFLKESDNKTAAILIVSSEKGLCGGYNSQLFKQVKRFMSDNKDMNIKFYFIGRKVKELLAREGVEGEKSFKFEKAEPEFEEVKSIAKELAKLFVKGQVGKLFIAYNSFLSAIEFESRVSQILPMAVSEQDKEKLAEEFPVDFKYEPSAETILDNLVPEVFNTTVFTSILDAIAAEHGSRMTAMDNATTNSKDMIKNLTLTANKLRQAAITTELTEIVSGAESLNS